MKLTEAYDRFQDQQSPPDNAYDWYRRSAKRSGSISFAGVDIPAEKEGGVWVVPDERVEEAVKAHQERQDELDRRLEEVRKGIYEEEEGTYEFRGGGYRNEGSFRLEWDNLRRARKKSDGTWYCKDCGERAEPLHEKEECHTCQDWGDCGRDCTLSAVICEECGNRLEK